MVSDCEDTIINYRKFDKKIFWMHCTKNSKQIFQKMKLRGLVPNFYINVSVSDLYIPLFAVLRLRTNRGNILIGHRYKNVEIGNNAARFHFWEYLSRIFCTVHLQCASLYKSIRKGVLLNCIRK